MIELFLLINNSLGKKYNIKSVRRLSDNTVFSINGRYFVNGDWYTIERFTMSDTRMMVKFIGIVIPWDISEIPVQPTPKTDTISTNNDDVACLSLNDVVNLFPLSGNEAVKRLKEYANQKLKQQTP
jgi:hypothetical protein